MKSKSRLAHELAASARARETPFRGGDNYVASFTPWFGREISSGSNPFGVFKIFWSIRSRSAWIAKRAGREFA